MKARDAQDLVAKGRSISRRQMCRMAGIRTEPMGMVSRCRSVRYVSHLMEQIQGRVRRFCSTIQECTECTGTVPPHGILFRGSEWSFWPRSTWRAGGGPCEELQSLTQLSQVEGKPDSQRSSGRRGTSGERVADLGESCVCDAELQSRVAVQVLGQPLGGLDGKAVEVT